MHSGRSGLSPPAGAVAAVPLWVLPTATSWHIGVLEQACWPSPELGRPGALAGFVFEAWWPSPGLGRLASLLGLFLGFGRVPGWGAWLFAARLFLLLGGRPLGRVPCWGARPSCGRVRFSSGLWPSPELGRPCISCRVVFVLGFGRVPVWGARHFGPGFRFLCQATRPSPVLGRPDSFRVSFLQAGRPSPELGRPALCCRVIFSSGQFGRVPCWGARPLWAGFVFCSGHWPSPELGRPCTLLPGSFVRASGHLAESRVGAPAHFDAGLFLFALVAVVWPWWPWGLVCLPVPWAHRLAFPARRR